MAKKLPQLFNVKAIMEELKQAVKNNERMVWALDGGFEYFGTTAWFAKMHSTAGVTHGKRDLREELRKIFGERMPEEGKSLVRAMGRLPEQDHNVFHTTMRVLEADKRRDGVITNVRICYEKQDVQIFRSAGKLGGVTASLVAMTGYTVCMVVGREPDRSPLVFGETEAEFLLVMPRSIAKGWESVLTAELGK